MNLTRSLLLTLCLWSCHAFAGADSAVPDSRSAAVRIGDYLEQRGIRHSVNVAPGDLTVRIYGVIPAPKQDALCASLSAPARKASAHSVSVCFYERVTGGASAVAFQASRLPSGNGDVSFAQNSDAISYRLLRTVRL
jgi:hypothetical protein